MTDTQPAAHAATDHGLRGSLNRAAMLQRLRDTPRWDLVVIGGGATGLGVALAAAVNGWSVALLEAEDFAKGTSSRATKLVHGGVRYLAQGHLSLVREALRERALLLANAPHLAQPLSFVMPAYRWWEPWFYGLGLRAYDWLAGERRLGATRQLNASATLQGLPGLRSEGLCGGVRYWDGQFDDARLALALARTAVAHGAVALNHCTVTGLRRDNKGEGGRITGVQARDTETGERFELSSACVVNAAGVWVDRVAALGPDQAANAAATTRPEAAAMVSPSQGIHVVVDRDFLPGNEALLIPKTDDGRVLFAVPWLGKTLLGTTDTPRTDAPLEPRPESEDVRWVLGEAARYLTRPPTLADVRSVWAGLRPLVRPSQASEGGTQAISREHTVRVHADGLVSVLGGKWTTYRAMADDVLAQCTQAALLPAPPRPASTEHVALVGAPAQAADAAPTRLSASPGNHLYGSEAPVLETIPGSHHWLWTDGSGGLSEAMVRFAARHEGARTVEDVLARRSRVLFLDAARAGALAEHVATLLAQELGRPCPPGEVDAFRDLARQYQGLHLRPEVPAWPNARGPSSTPEA